METRSATRVKRASILRTSRTTRCVTRRPRRKRQRRLADSASSSRSPTSSRHPFPGFGPGRRAVGCGRDPGSRPHTARRGIVGTRSDSPAWPRAVTRQTAHVGRAAPPMCVHIGFSEIRDGCVSASSTPRRAPASGYASQPCHGQAGSKSSRSRQWQTRLTASPTPRGRFRTTPYRCRSSPSCSHLGIVSAGRVPPRWRFPVRRTGHTASPTAKRCRHARQRHRDWNGLKLAARQRHHGRPWRTTSRVPQFGHSRSKATGLAKT